MFKQILLFLFVFPFLTQAQSTEVLHYEQAIALALQNNYDIQVAQNNASITQTQNSYGNAGFLPRLDLNATGSRSSNTTKQNFSSGLTVDQKGVSSNNLTSGVYLSWTIFDGLKMFATKEKLNLLEQQGSLALKLQIENTIEEVTLVYYQIVMQEQLIAGVEAAMSVSEERIKIANKKQSLGSGSNVEVLQAKLDLNAQKSNLIAQKIILNEYRNNLLVLLKSNAAKTFAVDSVFQFDAINSVAEIERSVAASNTSLLMARKETLIAKQSIREIRSQGLPKLGLTSNYLLNKSQNAAGFTLLNQNLGFNAGFTFSWNIFNGLNTHSQVKVAHLQEQNSLLVLEQKNTQIMSSVHVAYQRWLGDKEVLALEEENIDLAKQSLLITTERLKLGLGNYLETKESQSSFEAAITRLVTARFNVKQSEIALRKMTGELLQTR